MTLQVPIWDSDKGKENPSGTLSHADIIFLLSTDGAINFQDELHAKLLEYVIERYVAGNTGRRLGYAQHVLPKFRCLTTCINCWGELYSHGERTITTHDETIKEDVKNTAEAAIDENEADQAMAEAENADVEMEDTQTEYYTPDEFTPDWGGEDYRKGRRNGRSRSRR